MKKWTPHLLFAAAVLIFAAPLVAYQLMFDGSISSEHEVWAQFGSYISGVYAPVLSAMTLFVLFLQLQLQKRFGETAEAQKYLDTCESDLIFLIEHIKLRLNPPDNNGSSPQSLLDVFYYPPGDQDNLQVRVGYARFKQHEPELRDLWHSIHSKLRMFKNQKDPMYELAYQRAVSRLQVSLTYRTCTALDLLCKMHSSKDHTIDYIFLDMDERARTNLPNKPNVPA